MDDDLVDDEDLLNDLRDIVLRRVIAERKTPSSEGLKHENILPRAVA